jgi:hypothetical protein
MHYYKSNQQKVIKVLQKDTRRQDRAVLEKTYAAYQENRTYPTWRDER